MKKLLLSTIVLTAFAISLTLFEISCKKSANAQTPSYVLPPATTSKLGGVIPDGSTISVDGNGKISVVNNSNEQQNKILYIDYGTGVGQETIWSANYDGTDAKKINIILPSGLAIGDDVKLSPDHKLIFFDVFSINSNQNSIYACNLDGSIPHKVISTTSTGGISVKAAF